MYFTTEASYSESTAPPDNKGHRRMYLARVLVGEYTAGRPGLRRPPPKNANNPSGASYDSVVDDVNNPSVFVVFYDNQCYPEYLITFQ